MASAIDGVGRPRAIGAAGGGSTAVPVVLCLLVTMMEGYDLLVTGLAGPRMMADLGLSRSTFGLIASTMMAGFLVGSIAGGRLGDWLGRNRLLATALATVGAFSLAVPFVTSPAALAAVRFCAGVGLGAVLPNVYAAAGALAADGNRASVVAVVAAGGSVGAICGGGLVAIGGESVSWQALFLIGGAAPLLLAPFVLLGLPSSRPDPQARPEAPLPVRTLLFGGGRLRATVALWTASFCMIMILYLVMSWLPTILAERGLSVSHTGIVNTLVSVTGMLGSISFARLLDRGMATISFAAIYGGLIGAVCLMSGAHSFALAIVSALALGLFLYGGTTALYAVAILLYPPQHAATGAGCSIAVGRLGAILAPFAAGVAMDHGASSGSVLLAGMPLMAVSGLGLIWALGGRRFLDAGKA